jgi:arginase
MNRFLSSLRVPLEQTTVDVLKMFQQAPAMLNISNPFVQNIGIVSCGTNLGQRKKGVELGPEYILKSPQIASVIKSFKEQNNNLTQFNYYNVPKRYTLAEATNNIDAKIRNAYELSVINFQLYNTINNARIKNNLIINLLGDHSCGVGTVAASVKKYPDSLLVLWVDAHADINTNETTVTGNGHGVPLAIASGLCHDYCKRQYVFNWIEKYFDTKNLIYIGLRDVDDGERKIIKDRNITAIYADDIHQKGINACLESIKEKTANRDVHISFDVDVMDDVVFPCTGTPVPNGLQPGTVAQIIKHFAQNTNVHTFDITEFNPLIQTDRADECMKTLANYVLKPLLLD